MDCEHWPKIEGPPARQTTLSHTVNRAALQRASPLETPSAPQLYFFFFFTSFFSFCSCVPGASRAPRRSGSVEKKGEHEKDTQTELQGEESRLVPARVFLAQPSWPSQVTKKVVAQEPRCNAAPSDGCQNVVALAASARSRASPSSVACLAATSSKWRRKGGLHGAL